MKRVISRVISLWFPTFPTDRLSRRRGRERRPTGQVEASVTVTASQGGRRVAAASVPAQAGGVAPGMTLADGRALIPGLRAYPADPAADARALGLLAEWCERYSPQVATDASGAEGNHGLFLDISGSAHLFGGEAALLRELMERLPGLGFATRAGLADSPGAAWAVARFCAAAGDQGAIVAPGGAPQALADLPVTALRLPQALGQGLERVGLRRVGDLYRLPRGALARRFGAQVLRRLDQALGRAREPISPRRPVPRWHERLSFPEPVGHPHGIAQAVRHLLTSLCARLEREHRGLRRLELILYPSDGEVRRARVGTSRPVRDPDHLFRLLAEHLDELEVGSEAQGGVGVEVVVLSAPVTDPLSALQLSLTPERGPRGGPKDTALGQLVDRLGNRLGAAEVVRFISRESHIPERAALPVAPLSRGGNVASWPGDSLRPLRLLPRPEPVDAVAEVPDGPPVLFRWRRVVHRVARAEGPERIAPEWWRKETPQDAATRDYYRIEDVAGRRFWLYRQGLYLPQGRGGGKGGFETRPSTPEARPRWYLHGIFA